MIDFSVCRYKKYILMRADNAGYETDGKSAGRYGVGSADKVQTLSTHFFVLIFSTLRAIVQSADEVIVQIVQAGCR